MTTMTNPTIMPNPKRRHFVITYICKPCKLRLHYKTIKCILCQGKTQRHARPAHIAKETFTLAALDMFRMQSDMELEALNKGE